MSLVSFIFYFQIFSMPKCVKQIKLLFLLLATASLCTLVENLG